MNDLYKIIKNQSNFLHQKIISYREHIHQFPELSFNEFETAKFIKLKLEEIGIQNVQTISKTGVTALIYGKNHNLHQKFIGLRADLDALPIIEKNDVSYKSKYEGIMHACGHDVHTSILLGVAEILFSIKDELPQPIKLIFQPGEEKNPGGASILIKDGVLENPQVDKMFALHVFPELEVGKLGFKDGMYMASSDEIYITIQGKGGHGAMPHDCIDPIYIGANIITCLQQIVSRKCDPKIPTVLTFGYFAGLGETNVIPSEVTIKGTFRTMDENWRVLGLNEIIKQVKSIAASFGAEANIEISKGYPFLINDSNLTNDLKKKAKLFFGENNIIDLPIRLTSEDFAFYSHHVPVCFFRLGVKNFEKGIVHGVHNSNFDIDNEALKIGMEAMCLAVI
jgi:amidohydrolase